jgi:hypothetical protein
MKNNSKACCHTPKKSSSIKRGILYGLLPHSFCIAFAVFSILGVVGITSFFRNLLLTPNFFQILIGISIILALWSAIIYLYQCKCLSIEGIKKNIRYLSVLILSVVSVNLLLYLVVFPLTANINLRAKENINIVGQSNLSKITLKVLVPCSGHAPLIIDEVRKIKGVIDVKFRFPNLFDVTYSKEVTEDQILNSEIFKSFKAIKI